MPDITLAKTAAQLDAIGTTNSVVTELTSIAPNVETNLCQLTVPGGVWVFTSYWRFGRGNENFQASLGISTASGSSQAGSSGYTQFPITAECNVPSVGTTRIFSFSGETTVYLVAWHNGASDKSITTAELRAVRVA